MLPRGFVQVCTHSRRGPRSIAYWLSKGQGKGGKVDLPCKFFAEGECKLGAGCRFKHGPAGDGGANPRGRGRGRGGRGRGARGRGRGAVPAEACAAVHVYATAAVVDKKNRHVSFSAKAPEVRTFVVTGLFMTYFHSHHEPNRKPRHQA